MAARAGRCFTLAALALAIAGCASAASHATHPQAPAATAPPPSPSARVIDHLERPGALAAGPGGRLYVADDSLNEILRVLPGGRFAVIAGNGKAGFSGDGGPAASALLNDPGGIAVARSGTLYCADMGNNRIRAVSPSGIIHTVAGTGRWGGWVASGTPALRASLGDPSDVTLGPGGVLYLTNDGANQILKLTAARRLVLVAGTPGRFGAGIPHAGLLATRTPADGPNGIAFDRAGDLFTAGFDTKTLVMIAPDGHVSLPIGTDGFYPRGPGGLATAPRGDVLAMNTQQIDRVTSHGVQVLYNLPIHPRISIRGWASDGIAVAPDGTLYLDTWRGNGYASKTALIAIQPDGTVRVLWQS
jgi:DNA-binding beta-propeller fold protein YncE